MVDIRISGTTVLDELGDRVEGEMTPALAKAVLKGANFAGAAIHDVVGRVFPKGSGALGRSFLPARFVRTADGRIGAGALSDLVYARIQDEGGEIVPKNTKALAIPLNSKARRQWPREWPKDALFVWVNPKTKNKFLAAKVGKKKIEPMYLLRKRVTIRPKEYLEQARIESESEVAEITREAIQAALATAVE